MRTSIYTKVQIELGKMYSVKQYRTKYNNIEKLRIQAFNEDSVLCEKLNEILSLIRETIRLSNIKQPMRCSETIERIKSIESEVVKYCISVEQSNKPSWMIEAERHGWTPPQQ